MYDKNRSTCSNSSICWWLDFQARDSGKMCQQSEYLHVLWPSFHEKAVWVGDKGEVIGSVWYLCELNPVQCDFIRRNEVLWFLRYLRGSCFESPVLLPFISSPLENHECITSAHCRPSGNSWNRLNYTLHLIKTFQRPFLWGKGGWKPGKSFNRKNRQRLGFNK